MLQRETLCITGTYSPRLYKYTSKWFYLMCLDESEFFYFILLFAHRFELQREICLLLLDVVPKKNVDERQPQIEVLFPT